MMTKEELIAQLKEAATFTYGRRLVPSDDESWKRDIDPKAVHIATDKLLLDYINDPEVTAIYESVTKWYS